MMRWKARVQLLWYFKGARPFCCPVARCCDPEPVKLFCAFSSAKEWGRLLLQVAAMAGLGIVMVFGVDEIIISL